MNCSCAKKLWTWSQVLPEQSTHMSVSGPHPSGLPPSPLLSGCHSSHVCWWWTFSPTPRAERGGWRTHPSFRWLGRGRPQPQCLYSVLVARPIPSTSHLSSFGGIQKTAVRRKVEGKFHHSFQFPGTSKKFSFPKSEGDGSFGSSTNPHSSCPSPPCASHRHLLLNCKRPNPPGVSV